MQKSSPTGESNMIRGNESSAPRSLTYSLSLDSASANQRGFIRMGSLRQRSSWRHSISLLNVTSDRVLSSIRLSHELTDQILSDLDSSVIAQVGDSGDRILGEEEQGEIDRSEYVKGLEHRAGPISDDALIVVQELEQKDASFPSPAPLIADETLSPKEKHYKMPRRLDYCAYLIHLSVFGFFGVFTRYGLQKLFGPSLLALTSDQSPLYLDLPSNILGSFLMGWFGIVFKPDLRHVSDHLTVGLTTGYMGSLTTFSAWNQQMLLLSSEGHWMFAVAGMLLGMLIVNESIAVGVESAEGIRKLIKCNPDRWRVDTRNRNLVFIAIMFLILVTLWFLSGAFAIMKVHDLTDGAVLWMGCLVAPPGVWARWYLARLNGIGIGKRAFLKWFPIGTFKANVLAACFMAALSVISKAVNTERSGIIISGVKLGFLGCMSTVSTFVAEVYTMRQSGHSGRAFLYAGSTVILSFALGTLIYSVPVWARNYH